jgi:hypothetical protein
MFGPDGRETVKALRACLKPGRPNARAFCLGSNLDTVAAFDDVRVGIKVECVEKP